MAALITPEPLQRPALRATVEAAADYREAALERAGLRTLLSEEGLEPPCSCTQTDVDLFNARGCEAHDSESAWNAALRAVTTMEQYERYEPAATQPVKFERRRR
jgi:hypothetical protein